MRFFADTSFYVAVVCSGDVSHVKAMSIVKEFRGRTVTTEYVMVEVGNWLASSGDRDSFIVLNRQVHSDPKTLVVPADNALYCAGVDLYASRPDKDWSLTDCISFVVMQQFGLRSALTADRHFQQAGYLAVLA